MKIEHIAEICHEANRIYCESLGDFSQKYWTQAPAWQRDSSINGVTFILNNPTLTLEDQHNAWMKDKKEAGWKYGPEKDVDRKLHPCLVPYDELPKAQQKKDIIFRNIVKSLMNI